MTMGIMDGIAAAAGGVVNMMDKREEEQTQVRRDERQNELALIRAEAVAKLQQRMAQEEEDRKFSPEYLDKAGEADKYKATKALETRKGLMGQTADVAMGEYQAGAPLREQKKTEDLANWKSQYQAQTEAELQASIKKMNDPAYLAGKSKEARATHIDDGAGLRGIQMQAAQMALDEKRAEMKMPPAVKELAGSYREQLKSLSAVIDKGTLDGTSTPEGIKALEDKRTALSKKLSDTLQPYMGDKVKPEEDKAEPSVKYDAQGNAYVRGPDGKAVLKSSADKAAKPAEKPPAPKSADTGPKEGDTRTMTAGRGQGSKTQVYKRTGRGGGTLSWVDQ